MNQVAFLVGMVFLGFALAPALIARVLSPAPSNADKKKEQAVPPAKVLGPPLLLGRVGPFVSGKVLELDPRRQARSGCGSRMRWPSSTPARARAK